MSGTIVWFQRDLRLDDQPALAFAVAADEPVFPVFCLDDATEQPWSRGRASRWWLHHSLVALDRALQARGSRLLLLQGNAVEQLMSVVQQTGARRIVFTRCYEPWVPEQEQALRQSAALHGIRLHRFQSSLLHNPDKIRTGGGQPYKVFTPFWRNVYTHHAPPQPKSAPDTFPLTTHFPPALSIDAFALLPAVNWTDGLAATWTPGETGAAENLEQFLDDALSRYDAGRDQPGYRGTSLLSPHLHFGEISLRRVWHTTLQKSSLMPASACKATEQFLAELGWREFGYHILSNFPDTAHAPLRHEFSAFPWQDNADHLRAWQRGQTGYPIVDAGMRQLWATGWMHNRVRMCVASFLVKHLRQNWLKGAEWFWDTLVDADLASNTLGWQWSAGCGADAAPYFRIFNPILQGQKFDAQGDYVKRWVPELRELAPKFIHQPWLAPTEVLQKAGIILGVTYPLPIVDHATARQQALEALKSCNASKGRAQ